MNSRDSILGKLRSARQPFADVTPVEERHDVAPITDASVDALKARFIAEGEKLNNRMWQVDDDEGAIEKLVRDPRRTQAGAYAGTMPISPCKGWRKLSRKHSIDTGG